MVANSSNTRRGSWPSPAHQARRSFGPNASIADARSALLGPVFVLHGFADGKHESVTDADRGFCERCGSSLFWSAHGGPRVSIGAGTLDDPSGLRVAAHIWVEQGADWEAPPAGVPAYPRGYPTDAPALAWH